MSLSGGSTLFSSSLLTGDRWAYRIRSSPVLQLKPTNLSPMKIVLCLITIASLTRLAPSQELVSTLYPFGVDRKCGYMNERGKIIVNPRFDRCGEFSEGLAGVTIGRWSGYIDKSGEVKVDLKLDGVEAGDFTEGFATVLVKTSTGGTEFGYVDTLGKVTMFPGATQLLDFSEGLALITIGNRTGYIDKSLKFVIPPLFRHGNTFSEGLARVSDESGEYFIDKTGAKIISLTGKHWSSFSEDFTTIHTEYGYGFMDRNGSVVITPQFSSACLFHAGMACVEVKGKWGYIGKSGEVLILPQFEEAESFSSDAVAVVKLSNKYGFIDKTGRFLIAPRFEKARWIANGLGLVELGGRDRYINIRTGQFIKPKLNLQRRSKYGSLNERQTP